MVLKHLYTLLVVLVGFVIFRADNMGQAFSMIGAMFSGGSASAQTGLLLAQCLTPLTLFALAVGLVGSTPVLPLVCRKAEQQTGSVYACLQALSYAGRWRFCWWISCICRLHPMCLLSISSSEVEKCK